MRFKQIQPTIDDIAAEMMEYSVNHVTYDYADACRVFAGTGVEPNLKEISYEDALINAQMRMLKNELAGFFDDALIQCSGDPGDEFY